MHVLKSSYYSVFGCRVWPTFWNTYFVLNVLFGNHKAIVFYKGGTNVHIGSLILGLSPKTSFFGAQILLLIKHFDNDMEKRREYSYWVGGGVTWYNMYPFTVFGSKFVVDVKLSARSVDKWRLNLDSVTCFVHLKFHHIMKGLVNLFSSWLNILYSACKVY